MFALFLVNLTNLIFKSACCCKSMFNTKISPVSFPFMFYFRLDIHVPIPPFHPDIHLLIFNPSPAHQEQYFLPSKNHIISRVNRNCHTSSILTPNGKENAQRLAVSTTSFVSDGRLLYSTVSLYFSSSVQLFHQCNRALSNSEY